MKKVIATWWADADLDHRFHHKHKHMVLRSDSGTTSIQQVDYSLGQGEHWVPVFTDPTDEELSEFYDRIKKLIQEYEGNDESFTYMSPMTGKTQTLYYHECLRCRKEYTSTSERGNSGWCSHRCQTLAMADAYKNED